MLDFLFYIFQAIGSFFIILLFFHKAIFLFIISAFCWSLAIHNILLLNIKKKYKFFFVGLILAIIFGSGAYKQDYIFLVCAVIFTPIFLYLLRKKLHNFYIFKLQKSLIAFGLFGTMVCIWQLEVPQRIIVNYLSSINIFDEKYKDIVSENSLYEARVYTKNTKKLFLIEINEQDIYLCYKDKPFCKGTIEKIGERRLATYKYESTLHCALRLGGGCNWITPSNVGSFLGIYNLDNKINNKGK